MLHVLKFWLTHTADCCILGVIRDYNNRVAWFNQSRNEKQTFPNCDFLFNTTWDLCETNFLKKQLFLHKNNTVTLINRVCAKLLKSRDLGLKNLEICEQGRSFQ